MKGFVLNSNNKTHVVFIFEKKGGITLTYNQYGAKVAHKPPL